MPQPNPEPEVADIGEFSERVRDDRWQPSLDVFETEKAVVVRVELAGVRRGDLRVSVERDMLYVRGVRRPPEDAVAHAPASVHDGSRRSLA